MALARDVDARHSACEGADHAVDKELDELVNAIYWTPARSAIGLAVKMDVAARWAGAALPLADAQAKIGGLLDFEMEDQMVAAAVRDAREILAGVTSPRVGDPSPASIDDPHVAAWHKAKLLRARRAAYDATEDAETQALEAAIDEAEKPIYHTPAVSVAGIAVQFRTLLDRMDDHDIGSDDMLAQLILKALQRLSGFTERAGRVPGLDELAAATASHGFRNGHPDRQFLYLADAWRALYVTAPETNDGEEARQSDMQSIEAQIAALPARGPLGLAVKVWLIGFEAGCTCDVNIFDPDARGTHEGDRTSDDIAQIFGECLAQAGIATGQEIADRMRPKLAAAAE